MSEALAVNAKGQAIRVNQIWRDCDPRMVRFVKVVGYDDGTRRVQVVGCSEDGWCRQSSRYAHIALRRFHKHSTGFELAKEAS